MEFYVNVSESLCNLFAHLFLITLVLMTSAVLFFCCYSTYCWVESKEKAVDLKVAFKDAMQRLAYRHNRTIKVKGKIKMSFKILLKTDESGELISFVGGQLNKNQIALSEELAYNYEECVQMLCKLLNRKLKLKGGVK